MDRELIIEVMRYAAIALGIIGCGLGITALIMSYRR